MKELKSKVTVITGASAGVGRATAIAFGAAGSTVVVLSRNTESLAGTKAEVENTGGKCFYYQVDVADAGQVDKVVQTIEKDIGPIAVWVNNAMVSVFSPIKEMTSDEFKRVTEVTYLGQVYSTLSVLKYMLQRNFGKIILVGSALAYRGIPLQAAYCGAKHGVQGFFDSLRAELLHDKSNVRVTMVELPALNTTQFDWVKSRLPNKARPMGTVFQPEVAAHAIVYAATHNRREIFVAMPTFQAIIGNRFFPGILDRMMANTAFNGQQTEEPEDPNRKNNLWDPVPGNHRAQGPFGDIARSSSPVLWLSLHPAVFWGILFITLILLLILLSVIF